MRIRRQVVPIVVAGLAATGVVAVAGGEPAAAVPTGAVALPVVADPASALVLSVAGANPGRVLLSVRDWTGTRVDTGSSSLSTVAGIPRTPVPVRLTLAGDVAYWRSGTAGAYVVHRYDLAAGTQTTQDAGAEDLLAAGPTGWVGYDGTEFALHSGATRRVLLTRAGAVSPRVQLDGTHALVTYAPTATTVTAVLVDLTTAAGTTVVPAASRTDLVALTPSDVVWVNGTTLSRRDRTSGTVTTAPLPTSGVTHFAATDAAVAFRATNDASLVVVPAGAVSVADAVTVTGLSSAIDVDARGNDFVVARGASGTTAALFSVTAAGVSSRFASVPPAPERPIGLVLDNGRVAYAGSTLKGTDRLQPRRRVRTVSGDVTLSAGPESASSEEQGQVALSGTRTTALTLSTVTPLEFRDRGAVTGGANGLGAKISGPYAVVDGTGPYRVSGGRIALPAADGTPLAADVYGSRFAYVTSTGTVRLLDAAAPRSTTNPRTLASNACNGALCSPTVRIAADTVAWSTSGGGTVRDLAGGTSRTIPDFPRAVGDGVVVYGTPIPVALDVAGGTATSLGVTSPSPRVAADDHRVAWTASDGAITVARLPFGPAHRPRVLGVVQRSSFSPNGDGAVDTWSPAIDLSKPVPSVTLTIRRGTTVVRQIGGTGALGSVRDLVWDGRTTSGAAAPDGVYTWTLTGDAADGDGGVVALDGTSPATGTVVVDRVAETAKVVVPASSASARTTTGIPLTWRRTSAASTAHAVFDVRWRDLSYDNDARKALIGPVFLLRPNTTATSYVVPSNRTNHGGMHEFSVRMRDAAGNTGPWSPWVAAQQSLDDREMTRLFGTWTRSSSSGAFRGTVSSATSNGAELDGEVLGSTVYVWATTCPTCGRMDITVSNGRGSFRFGVDTRSATTRKKVLVWSGTVPRGWLSVMIRPDGTKGRPKVVVDAVGSKW